MFSSLIYCRSCNTKEKKKILKMLTMRYDYNYSTSNVVFHFCEVLSLFVIRSKKRFYFRELRVIFIKAFARIKSSLFFKKSGWGKLSLLWSLQCLAPCILKTTILKKLTAILMYAISADCSAFFLLCAFFEQFFCFSLLFGQSFEEK